MLNNTICNKQIAPSAFLAFAALALGMLISSPVFAADACTGLQITPNCGLTGGGTGTGQFCGTNCGLNGNPDTLYTCSGSPGHYSEVPGTEQNCNATGGVCNTGAYAYQPDTCGTSISSSSLPSLPASTSLPVGTYGTCGDGGVGTCTTECSNTGPSFIIYTSFPGDSTQCGKNTNHYSSSSTIYCCGSLY